MVSNKTKLSKKLAKLLDTCHEKWGEPMARDITVSTDQIQHDLKKWGIAIINNPISEADWDEYILRVACELSEHLFDTDNPFDSPDFCEEFNNIENQYPTNSTTLQIIKTFAKWWNSSGDFGNSNFRFIFFQALDQKIKFKVGEKDIVFSRNPIYRWNLKLLSTEPRLWNILKSFHPDDRCFVSWDSAKVRINHPKATKPALTKRHRDVYNYNGVPIDRKQAMLIKQEPGSISLGWVIYSHIPEIQQLLTEYFGKEPNKFDIVEDPLLNPIFDKYWRGTVNNSFVVWEQSTIHYEAEPNKDINGITSFKSFTQPLEAINLLSIRVAIGTQAANNLSKKELQQIGYLADYGFCPGIYSNPNSGTAVGSNTVDKKTTMWKKKRPIKKLEKQELEKAFNNYTYYYKYIKNLHPNHAKLLGL